MGVLDVVTYWWPGILAVVLLVVTASSPRGPNLLLVAALLALQALVIVYRVVRFGVREVRERSVQN